MYVEVNPRSANVASFEICSITLNTDSRSAYPYASKGHNSTRTIKTSYATTDLFDSLLSFFGRTPENREAILNVTEFGSYTANFRKASPPIPPEYLIGLYTIVASSIIGYSSIIGWSKFKMQGRNVFRYHQRIKSLFDDNKIDELNS